jgi:hypothetical protein
VDKYLSATGYLPGNVKPFFIALPKVRHAAAVLHICWVSVCGLSMSAGGLYISAISVFINLLSVFIWSRAQRQHGTQHAQGAELIATLPLTYLWLLLLTGPQHPKQHGVAAAAG